jgi:hypothetical protein
MKHYDASANICPTSARRSGFARGLKAKPEA